MKQKNIINVKLPFFPWMDSRLAKLPGTNKVESESVFLNCDKFKEQLELRDSLVKAKANKVCIAKPGTDKVLDEVLETILDSLKCQQNYEVNKHYVIRPDNVKIDLNDGSKVKIIARLIQEDILVHQLDPSDNLYKLTAGALCFPSFWTLSQKMGMNLERIHKPVPEYTKDIAKRVDRLFLGLKVDQPIWRANWTVKNNPILFNPLLEDDTLPEPFTTEKEWWVRVERQTFNKLSESGAVIFGIHTFIVAPTSLNEEQLETLKDKIKEKSLIHHKQE